jgi:hypothetical protein
LQGLKLGPFNDIEGENKHMISPDGLSFDESLALDLNNKMAMLEELLNGGGGAFATFLTKDEILHLLRSLAKFGSRQIFTLEAHKHPSSLSEPSSPLASCSTKIL